MTDPTESPALVLVRYGELSLKGNNRRQFENALVQNIRTAIAPITRAKIIREHGRVTIHPERRAATVARRMQEVFGIASISLARRSDPTPEAIAAAAGPVYA